MQPNTLKSLALIPLLALSACTVSGPGDRFREVLPDDRVLINLPTQDAAKDAADGEWSEYYLFTAKVTDDVNGLIGFTLVLVDTITKLEPAQVDEEEQSAVWGPYSDALDPVETLLWVDYDAEADTYAWAFQQKPKGSEDDAYVTVVAGVVDEGATHEVHSGRFAIDFTTMQELDPNVGLSGVFYSDYDVQEAGVVATAAFEAVDDRDEETVDALYAYDQTFSGEGAMDLAWLADATGNGQEETHIVRSRWTNRGEGRSDAYLTGGQLGEIAGTVSECWDGRFNAVYRIEQFLGQTDEEGDLGACAWDQAEWSEDAEPQE